MRSFVHRLLTIPLLSVVLPVFAGEPPKGWSVLDLKGSPCLYQDGKPVTPVMFWQWDLKEQDVRDMTRTGMQLFSMFGSTQHYADPYWKEDGSFGMDFQDNHIRQLLGWSPDCFFLPRVFTTAPDWWVRENPSETVAFSKPGYTPKTPRESFASQKLRDEQGPVFRKAVHHLMEEYGDHLFGIHVTNGPWGEHFSWDAQFGSAGSDLSGPMRLAFSAYLREKYGNDVKRLRAAFRDDSVTFENVQVPSYEKRRELTDGSWRDPARLRWVTDYFECHNAVTVDMIDYYCRIVKEESGNSLTTLVFYGYTQDETWAIEADHRAPSKLYRLESVDMMSAPHTYKRRRLGEDGQPRQYLASATLHGKLFVDEGDDMTHLEYLKPHHDSRAHCTTMDESLAVLYREFGIAVTHGIGLWYMDLKQNTFRDPQLVDAVGRMKKWGDESMNHPRGHISQVAVVSNPESEFYLGYRSSEANNISEGLYLHQMGALYRAGAPFDWYLADDLDAVADRNYRVVIFLDCQYMTEKQRSIVERLKSDGRTLVWFHATGYVTKEGLSQPQMEALSGFRLKKEPHGKLLAENVGTGEITGMIRIPRPRYPIRCTSAEEAENNPWGFTEKWEAPSQNDFFSVVPDVSTRVISRGVEELQGSVLIAQKDFPSWRSVFSSVPGLSPALLHEIYRESGVHVYTDTDAVISANASWVMLHTRESGNYEVKLPKKCTKVTEITTEKVVAEKADRFTVPLGKFQTAIFLLEP